MRDDEFIILMDLPMVNGQWLAIDDLKRLRDAGIQTAYMHGSSMGDLPGKIYDYIIRVRAAGMKIILPLYNKQATDLPDEWYVKTRSRQIQRGVLSPWNKDAMDYYNSRLMSDARLYSDADVLVISSWLMDGETVMLNEPAYYDDCALADYEKRNGGIPPDYYWNEDKLDPWLQQTYTRLLVNQQKALENTEIWYQAHRQIATYDDLRCNGCKYIDAYLDAWQTGGVEINHISFTYFPHGPNYCRKCAVI